VSEYEELLIKHQKSEAKRREDQLQHDLAQIKHDSQINSMIAGMQVYGSLVANAAWAGVDITKSNEGGK